MDFEKEDVFSCEADFVDNGSSVQWIEVGECKSKNLYKMLNYRTWDLLYVTVQLLYQVQVWSSNRQIV